MIMDLVACSACCRAARRDVVTDGASVERAELHEWCDQRLPAFARPKFVNVIDTLPMTPSGKVRKVELRERAVALAAQTDILSA